MTAKQSVSKAKIEKGSPINQLRENITSNLVNLKIAISEVVNIIDRLSGNISLYLLETNPEKLQKLEKSKKEQGILPGLNIPKKHAVRKQNKAILPDSYFVMTWADVFPQLGLNYTTANNDFIIKLCQGTHRTGGIFKHSGKPNDKLFYYNYARISQDENNTILFSAKFLQYLAKKLKERNMINEKIYDKIMNIKLKYIYE